MTANEWTFLGLNAGTWFGIAALLVTLLSSVVVSVLGYRSAGKDREARIVVSHLDRQHQLTMAREARVQDRLEGAYADLETQLDRYAELVSRRLQRVVISSEPPPIEMPTQEELRALIARVRLLASQEVRNLLEQLFRGWMTFQFAIGSYEQLRSFADGDRSLRIETKDSYDEMDRDGQAVLQTIARLEAQMRRDLGIAEPETKDAPTVEPAGTE
jgi:hypothetical protein